MFQLTSWSPNSQYLLPVLNYWSMEENRGPPPPLSLLKIRSFYNSAFSLCHSYLPAQTGTGVRPAPRMWGWARRQRQTATSGRTSGGQRPSTPPPPPPSPRLPHPPPPSTSPPTHWLVFRSFLFLSSILSHHPPCQCGVQYSRPQAVVFDLNRPRTEHCAAPRSLSGNFIHQTSPIQTE